jgi:hypothetical protein
MWMGPAYPSADRNLTSPQVVITGDKSIKINHLQEGIMKKAIYTALFAAAMSIGSAYGAEIIVRTAPPRAIVEHRVVAPSGRHVWIAGYHRWDGRAYAWVPGRWELPPREHVVWVAPRWEHRRDGYVFVEGRWR